MSDSNNSLVLAVGIVCLILLLSSGMLFWKFLSRRSIKKDDSGRIPPNVSFFLSRVEAMSVVRDILANGTILGCRWRITYDRAQEGRIQARLFANPAGGGGTGNVDILLNMIFHRLEPFKTELEWSYVVISGDQVRADRVIDASNAAFRRSLQKAQLDKSSPDKVDDTTYGIGVGGADDLPAVDAMIEGARSCSKCAKELEPGFAFCIYCGAALA